MDAAGNTEKRVRIGKYEILSHIAAGGMGAVYKAIDRELDREVALKVMNPTLMTNPNNVERFRREAKASAKLQHKNIVAIYEFGEDKGAYYLALEYVKGVDLHSHVHRNGRLEPREAMEILRQSLKALDHAHRQGIIHRDIKPSNFLLGQLNGKPLVKLTDLGLARQENEDEFRVTRAGTTVGTVDYMSPEQAKDSATADARSDIYSLGCTLFHMLTGHAPFPEGSLVERIYKHLEAPPPDIRTLNESVPEGLSILLEKMLAKKPEDRYQSARQVLEDLVRVDKLKRTPSPGDVLENLLKDEQQPTERKKGNPESPARGKARPETGSPSDPEPGSEPTVSTKPRDPAAKTRLPPRTKSESRDTPIETESIPQDRQESTRKPDKPGKRSKRARAEEESSGVMGNLVLYLILAAIGILVVIGGVVAVIIVQQPGDPVTQGSGSGSDTGGGSNASGSGSTRGSEGSSTAQGRWISPAVAQIDLEGMTRELANPWTSSPPDGVDPVTVKVARSSAVSPFQQGHTLLGKALSEVQPNTKCIIEIYDNGPLPEPPAVLDDVHITLRAAPGFRPLLVWDQTRRKDLNALLTVHRGSLTLEGIDVVVKWNEVPPEPIAFFQMVDANFHATDCSFSAVGRSDLGLSVVRMDGTVVGKRCRLERCFSRGNQLTTLDFTAPAVDCLIERSILVSGVKPIVRATVHNANKTTVRVLRSTLSAQDHLFFVQSTEGGDKQPAFQWIGGDSLLTRSHTEPGGTMLRLAQGHSAGSLLWRAENCLYAGWQTLLESREDTISSANTAAWKQRFQTRDCDKAVDVRWPAFTPGELGIRPLRDFAILPTHPVAYGSASKGENAQPLLGCNLNSTITSRDRWNHLAYDGKSIEYPELLTDQTVVEIPAPLPGQYSGEKMTPTVVKDIGKHLDEIQKTTRLAGKVVLKLAGSGEWPSSAIRVRGVHLVLHFDTSESKDGKPVILTPVPALSKQEPLIEVQDGTLEIIGGEFKTGVRQGSVPTHLIHLVRSNFSAYGCRFYGPLPEIVEPHKSLIRWENAGDEQAQPRTLTVNESIVMTGATALQISGSNMRMRVQQSIIVAAQDGFHLDTTDKKRAVSNFQCLLESNTFAAKRAVVRLDDSQTTAPEDGCLFQTRNNAFWAPFSEALGKPQPKSGVILYQGDALAKGSIVWQGDANVYDKRIFYYLGVYEGLPVQQTSAFWNSFWGSVGDVSLVVEQKTPKTIDLRFQDQLTKLVFPSELGERNPVPGADFVKLKLIKPIKGPN